MLKCDIVRLRDGSRVEFVDGGDPQGVPVIAMHGYVHSARGVVAPTDESARRHGVRLIAPNRPGIGASRSKGVRLTKADRVRDVLGLADALGIERFAMFGVSAGAGDALAVLALAPQRARVGAVISGLAPIGQGRHLWQLPRHFPYMLRLAQLLPSLATAAILWLNLCARCRSRDSWLRRLSGLLSPDDNHLLRTRADFAELFWNDHQEIFERGEGPFALMQEVRRMCYWGFRPESVPPNVPILFMHGNEDPIVSPQMASGLARRIRRPGGVRLKPDLRFGGHLMILKERNLGDLAGWLRTSMERVM